MLSLRGPKRRPLHQSFSGASVYKGCAAPQLDRSAQLQNHATLNSTRFSWQIRVSVATPEHKWSERPSQRNLCVIQLSGKTQQMPTCETIRKQTLTSKPQAEAHVASAWDWHEGETDGRETSTCMGGVRVLHTAAVTRHLKTRAAMFLQLACPAAEVFHLRNRSSTSCNFLCIFNIRLLLV